MSASKTITQKTAERSEAGVPANRGMTVSAAAQALGATRSTVYRLINNGLLWGWAVSADPTRYTGRLRIDPESLDQYKRRFQRGGAIAASSTPPSMSIVSRRRTSAENKNLDAALLSLKAAGITFRKRHDARRRG